MLVIDQNPKTAARAMNVKSKLATQLVPRVYLYFMTFLWRLASIFSENVMKSIYTTRVVMRATIIVLEFSLRKYRTKLGESSFQCLLYAIAEHYFIELGNYELVESFLEEYLSPFMYSHLRAGSCFNRLQEFAMKNVMPLFLHELKYVQNRNEARQLAFWISERIVHKPHRTNADLVMDSRFAVVLIGRKHARRDHVSPTMRYIKKAIERRNARRIYVLSAGKRNVDISLLYGILLTNELGLERLFIRLGPVAGGNHMNMGLLAAYGVA